MEIRLIDGSCVVTWERTSAEIHSEILDRLKRINGAAFDKSGSCWRVPAQQADRLYSAFPKASFDYDAVGAVVDAQERRIAIFGKNLLDMGVKLTVANGRLIAQGDGVSPLLQSLVDERGEKLRVWLASNTPALPHEYVCGTLAGAMQVQSINDRIAGVSGVSGEVLRQAGLLAESLRNAAQNQYQEEAMRQQRRRRAKETTCVINHHFLTTCASR